MSSPRTAPTLHVRPARGWLNDPNGVTRNHGRWHVFFQHNPSAARHAYISWGHVSSRDLVTWTEHPVAFGPQPGGPDQGGCWSGSFLPWGPPAVTYTGVVDGDTGTSICVRYAQDDDLDSWSDPVAVAFQPDGVGVRAMRDPFPFRWGGRRWAVLGAGMADGTPALLLYNADDAAHWTFQGSWLHGGDPVAASVAPADIWECPQFVPVGDRWLLVLSLQTKGVLQDVVYLLGDIREDPNSPGTPQFVPHAGGVMDEGPDFYAPQVVDDGGEDPLMFGWVREGDAADDARPDEVAGCLTLPRRLSLEGDVVQVRADPALDALLAEPVPFAGPAGEPGGRWTAVLPPQARIDLDPAETISADELRLVAGGEVLTLRTDGRGCQIWLDGEVVEVYHHQGRAETIRRPGIESWTLETTLDPERIRVHALSSPQR